VERLRLDERVAISFATHLTWADGVPSPPRPLPSSASRAAKGPYTPAAAPGSWQSNTRELAERWARPLTSFGGSGGGVDGRAVDFAGKINVSICQARSISMSARVHELSAVVSLASRKLGRHHVSFWEAISWIALCWSCRLGLQKSGDGSHCHA